MVPFNTSGLGLDLESSVLTSATNPWPWLSPWPRPRRLGLGLDLVMSGLAKIRAGRRTRTSTTWNADDILLCDDLPVQLKPSPIYPTLQAHVKLPIVLVQSALILHPPLFTAHSSMSTPSYVIIQELQYITLLSQTYSRAPNRLQHTVIR